MVFPVFKNGKKRRKTDSFLLFSLLILKESCHEEKKNLTRLEKMIQYLSIVVYFTEMKMFSISVFIAKLKKIMMFE